MARLTKADRRKAALKGWPRLAKLMSSREDFETWHGHTASFPTARAAQNWKSALQRAWREDPDLAERAAYAGKDYRKVIKQGMKRNPPKGFIPCRAVKITRNRGGGVEVRIKRR
jgi:hypothetical protein